MLYVELLGQLAGGTPVIAQFLGALKEAASKLGGGGSNGNGTSGKGALTAPAAPAPAAPPSA